MKVVKGKNQMSQPDGIIMANGMVLKDNIHKFEADEEIIKESLSYIAKISKGLHSGVLNSDSDFIEYQQESMNELIERETNKLCKKVVLGAESQLKMISTNMMANRAVEQCHTFSNFSDNVIDTQKIHDIIKERSDKLAVMNKEELEYIKDVNKEAGEIFKKREKLRKKIINKKKVAKKKANKNDRE